MCGRYSVLTEDEIIEVRRIIQEVSLSLVKDMANYAPPRAEIRPTDSAPVITRNDDGLWFESAHFGFKKWDGKGVIINARSETAGEKGMFAKHLNTGRCVVPAGEYYEWRESPEPGGGKKKKAKKKKHFIADKDGNILFFAGLYRDGGEGREFVIITKASCGAVSDVHDRMPVILRVNQLEAWLSGKLAPADIVRMDFGDTAVAPCGGDDAESGGYDQLSLFD
jgi:putative SOS response-associated peptidase YedK